jgi:hypothetical protein
MQLAKLIGDIATGELSNDSPRPEAETPATAARRKWAKQGGKARAKALPAAKRKAIAKKAARVRWQS